MSVTADRSTTVERDRRARRTDQQRRAGADVPLSGEGRLTYPSGRGRRSAIVRYRRSDDQVILRIPEFNHVTNDLQGATVVLEPRPIGIIGTVTGTASVLPAASPPPIELEGDLESWPTGILARYVVIAVARPDRHRDDRHPGGGADRPRPPARTRGRR